MRRPLVLPACLLLLWTLTAFVSADDSNKEIQVKMKGADKIELVCPFSGGKWTRFEEHIESNKVELEYKDENSGEYTCSGGSSGDTKTQSIYVKFRTCDNCIELDVGSVTGLAIGDLVATVVIGVAVYLVASQARVRPIASPQNKGSDRQHLVPNEITSRSSNEHYERLRHKGQKETYDVINKR